MTPLASSTTDLHAVGEQPAFKNTSTDLRDRSRLKSVQFQLIKNLHRTCRRPIGPEAASHRRDGPQCMQVCTTTSSNDASNGPVDIIGLASMERGTSGGNSKKRRTCSENARRSEKIEVR